MNKTKYETENIKLTLFSADITKVYITVHVVPGDISSRFASNDSLIIMNASDLLENLK